MTPTRRGFLGRIVGGLVALLGGKRTTVTQEVPLVVPDEWRWLADSISKSPYLGMTIEEFAAMPYRGYGKQVPYLKEILVDAPLPDPKDAAQAALDACGIKPGQIYRYYKGGLCCIVTTAIKEDTMEPMVVYRDNILSEDGSVLVRTLESWLSMAEKPVAYIANDRETITRTVEQVVERVPRFSRVKE